VRIYSLADYGKPGVVSLLLVNLGFQQYHKTTLGKVIALNSATFFVIDGECLS
jgi:hypothetical protein